MFKKNLLCTSIAAMIIFAFSATGYAGQDRIARLGEKLGTTGQLCDGGISYWQAVTEFRAECAAETVDFSTSYFISDDIMDADGVEQCILELGEEQQLLWISVTDLYDSSFYRGFDLWRSLAEDNKQTLELRAFRKADHVLGRLFDLLARGGDEEIFVFENYEFDGGQSDFLYVYDVVSMMLYRFKFSCG